MKRNNARVLTHSRIHRSRKASIGGPREESPEHGFASREKTSKRERGRQWTTCASCAFSDSHGRPMAARRRKCCKSPCATTIHQESTVRASSSEMAT
eukprot:110923-Alexandrium_andersonii.AAC.1